MSADENPFAAPLESYCNNFICGITGQLPERFDRKCGFRMQQLDGPMKEKTGSNPGQTYLQPGRALDKADRAVMPAPIPRHRVSKTGKCSTYPSTTVSSLQTVEDWFVRIWAIAPKWGKPSENVVDDFIAERRAEGGEGMTPMPLHPGRLRFTRPYVRGTRQPGADVVLEALKSGAHMPAVSAVYVAEVASRLHQEGWTSFQRQGRFPGSCLIQILPFDLDALQR